jgi:hypothetical protein
MIVFLKRIKLYWSYSIQKIICLLSSLTFWPVIRSHHQPHYPSKSYPSKNTILTHRKISHSIFSSFMNFTSSRLSFHISEFLPHQSDFIFISSKNQIFHLKWRNHQSLALTIVDLKLTSTNLSNHLSRIPNQFSPYSIFFLFRACFLIYSSLIHRDIPITIQITFEIIPITKWGDNRPPSKALFAVSDSSPTLKSGSVRQTDRRNRRDKWGSYLDERTTNAIFHSIFCFCTKRSFPTKIWVTAWNGSSNFPLSGGRLKGDGWEWP